MNDKFGVLSTERYKLTPNLMILLNKFYCVGTTNAHFENHFSSVLSL